MVFLNKKGIIRNVMLVIGGIFALIFSILLINDLESETITQWTVMTSYFMIIFMIIGIALRITQK
ncbi:hypothetical protein OAJ02_07530 [Nitrosopumilus sp.]|nr:hypothetical protein [Nitrosopumilus sp.]MDC0330129.1 hypothetical protein [Nitrosopumilus sp.]MDC0885818.1 hypothetical protein [Nitrosopumilus sp.]